MSLPGWLAGLAGLDDDALAAVGSRGLVRRATKLVADGAVNLVAVDPVAASAGAVEVACGGVVVRLVPGGPNAARCPCPVAGVCVHVLAACVWARGAFVESEADAVAGASERPGAAGSTDPPADVPGHASADVLAEVLAWAPEAVSRAAGITAVRRVAREWPGGETTIEARGAQLMIAWPGSPQVIAIAGAGPAGMVVEGSHSDVAERAWRLAAVVRVFAAHGRDWAWPVGLAAGDGVQPTQVDAAMDVAAAAEQLVADGLARAGRGGSDRLSRAGQRARLGDLPLLARLTGAAVAQVKALAERRDDVDEAQAFSALAQAWALARGIAANTSPPAALIGAPSVGASPSTGEHTSVHLIPLAARWWQATSGARGLTLHAWDDAAGRLETATNGRAAGADPSFTHGWNTPLLWGASAQQLCAGPLDLVGAERRDDGTLSATARTTVTPGTWAGLDLDALTARVNAGGEGVAKVAFGAPTQRTRVIRPRRAFGLGAVELDEVNQQFVLPVTDTSGRTHRLALEASERNSQLLTWLIDQAKLLAIVAVDDQPEAAFLATHDGPSLISLSLTPLPLRATSASWKRRLLGLAKERRVTAPLTEQDDVQRLCAGVGDVALALASTGARSLTARQLDAVGRRRREASNIGLGTLCAALEPLAAGQAEAGTLLSVRFILDRLESLLS